MTTFRTALLAFGGMITAVATAEEAQAATRERPGAPAAVSRNADGETTPALPPGRDGPALPGFLTGIAGFQGMPLELPTAQELLDGAREKAKSLMETIERAAASRQALDRISQDFDLEKISPLSHLAPGLIEFTSDKSGVEQRYIATDRDVFMVRECASEREKSALAKAEEKVARSREKVDALTSEIEEIPALTADFDIVRWSESLKRIDTGNLAEPHRRKLEEYVAACAEHDVLVAEAREWREACGTRALETRGGGPATKAVMTSNGGDHQIVLLDAAGEPERVLQYAAGKAGHHDTVIEDAVKALVDNDSKSYARVVRCGQFAARKLRDLVEGRIEVPEKDRAAAQLVGGYLLARLKDEAALEPLLRVVRGQIRPKDGYTRVWEGRSILLSVGPSFNDEMRECFKDPSPKVRALAAEHFHRYPDEKAIEGLRELLEDRDKYVRRHAALALAATRDEAVLQPLVTLLEQNVPDLSDDAAIYLGCYGTRDTLAVLEEALDDPVLAGYAAEGLCRTNHHEAVGVLRAHATGDASVEDISEGLLRWAQRGSPEARDAMILGSLNPNATKDFREKVETQLISLSPELEKELPDLARRMLRAMQPDAPAWHGSAYETFVTARSLGIEFLNRIPEEHREEILSNRVDPRKDDRPLAVMICARGDHNGAFYLSHTLFAGLCTHDYRVMYYEAGSDEELIEALKGATALGTADEQKASIVIIGGHGSQSSLHLERDNVELPGQRGILDPADEEALRSAGISACLEDGGTIVLDSCSNGEGGSRADGRNGRPLNMANFMRRIFPNARELGIFSAMESYGPIELVFGDDNRLLDVRYPVPQYRVKPEAPAGEDAAAP